MKQRKNPARTTALRRQLPAWAFASAALLAADLSAQTAPETKPENKDEIVTMSPFTVSTDRDQGYRASNSIAGTRTNTPIKDIPLNIQVFTKDLFDDLTFTNQTQLETYNASMVNGGADTRSNNAIQQAYNSFLFRGFIQNWGIRDGIREYDPIDLQGISRVEVVKGPAAPLYGLAYPGGVMNNITKQVDFSKNFTGLDFTLHSEGEKRAAIDTNFAGALAQGKFGVRVNAAYTDSEDERAHSKGRVEYTQINLAWKPAEATTVTFLGEHGYRGKPNGLGYFQHAEWNSAGVALDNGASVPLQVSHPEIPWTWNWSNGRNLRSLDTDLYRGTIEQSVGDNFFAKAYWQYSAREQRDGDGWDSNGSGGADSWEAGGGAIWNPLTGKATRIDAGYSYRDWSNQMHSYGATGVYKLDFEQVKNTFSFGAAAWSERFISRSYNESNPYGDPSNVNNPFRLQAIAHAAVNQPTIISYAVQANIPINAPFAPPAGLHPNNGQFDSTSNGFTHENSSNDYYFATWQLSAFDNRLKTNIGFNKTNVKLVQWSNGFSQTPNVTVMDKVSPLYGAMFDITKEVSIFAARSSSLFPDTTKNSFGTQMPPQVGKGNEIGVKLEVLEGKISGTISYYKISQTGGSVNNPLAENLNTQRWDSMTPAQRAIAFPGAASRSSLLGDLVPNTTGITSKGIEADLIIQPTKNWQALVSYAKQSGVRNAGNVRNQLSVLTSYAFTEGDVSGLKVGLGFRKAAKSYQNTFTNSAGTISVDRYYPSTLDAEIFGAYKFKMFGYDSTVQLNVKNITKQEEYVGWKATGSAATVATSPYEVSTPIRYSLSLGLDF